MEILLSLCIGIGLSAACGFRVFVPLLMVSIASLSGHLSLATGFQWMGTYPALIAFALATALEIGAYYIPWVDNLLDTLATPAAVIAGTIVTASLVTDLSPFLKWTLAVIAGGGVAGLVQSATVGARSVSSVGTGGLTNPILATVELGGSILTSIMAIVVPVLTILLVAVILFFAVKKIIARFSRRTAAG